MLLRITRFIGVAMLAFVVSACSTVTKHKYQSIGHSKRPSVERIKFDPSTLKQGSGEAHLVGRVYLRDNQLFQEYVGAQVEVVLNPVSQASTQWFKEVCQRGKRLVGEVDPLYEHAMLIVKSNDYGQFAFPNVPTGEYYISSRIYRWDEAPFSGPVEYGGLLAKKVTLTAGAVSVDLNQQNACPGYYH